LLLAAGCSTAASPAVAAAAAEAAEAGAAAKAPAHRADPWEPFNRDIFAFNEAVDQAVVRPVAELYRKVLPQVVRTGVGNVFGNVEDAWSAVNQFLQGKPGNGLDMTLRVATNSLLGIAGAIDIASDLGLERRSEDLGQTLGRWGVPPGPYLVVPVFGPRTLRDAAALPVDRYVGLTNLVRSNETYGFLALELAQVRSELLTASRLADELAFDKYVFIRDAYLARRRSQVYDGDPPEEPREPEEREVSTPNPPSSGVPAPAPR
jgi:phospholipid-binding lipoprotein MlaA